MYVVPPKYRGTKAYQAVYRKLVQAAKTRSVITYKEIASIMGLPPSGNYMGKEVGYILGEISEDEVSSGRPMLSALAVSSAGTAGEGFYILARQLGFPVEDDKYLKNRFWKQECYKVYAAWKEDPNKS